MAMILCIRIIGLDLDGLSNHLAHLPSVFDQPCCLGLHHEVTDDGSFGRARYYGHPNSFGYPLVELVIA